MKKKRKWLRALLVLALLCAAVAAAAVLLGPGGSSSAAYREETVTAGGLTTYYNFDGLVEAPRTQTFTAGAQDVAERVYVSRNQRVAEGDRLYALRDGGVVRADMDGEVTRLDVTEGGVVSAGATLCEIIDMTALEARLNVDEYDVAAVPPGAEVEVTVLATDARVTGSVSALDKRGTASGDLSYYAASVPLPEMPDVYPGMQVSARVLRGQVENANILRLDALQFDEYNEPYVLVRGADGEPERRAVTVGLSDGIYCELLSGASAGETVLVPSGMSMLELMEQMRQSARN